MYGPIGEMFAGDSITPAAVSAALRSAPDATSVKVYLNSPGGFVADGAGIRAIFANDRRDIEIEIEGIAASIATTITAGATRVRMHADAVFMIHEAASGMAGSADDLRAEANALDRVNAGMADIYAARSKQPVAKVREWMAAETWFSAAEAQAAGFVDEVIPVRATAQARAWDLSMYANAPRAQNLSSPKKKDIQTAMTPEILKKLNLPADATEAQVLAALDATLKPAGETAPTASAQPTVAEIVSTVLEAQRAAAAILAAPAAETAHATATAACVDKHIAAKKIAPKDRVKAIAACGANAASLAACDALWTDAQPIVAEPSALGVVPRSAVTAGAKGEINALTPNQKRMCAKAGIKEADFMNEWNRQVHQ